MEFLNGVLSYEFNLSKWIMWTDLKVSQVKFIYQAFIQDSPFLVKEKTNIQKAV